ncbi:hypothetical protein CDAR_236661 [Caerostris darwini]|uniref:Uncharacterized protein n=1 Tax=Caerostris darwini TaxID=1538125 RepID=A0AAV4NH40_9ARAC|nr:hypothetical protein CDAR_236661 [Caerostris darwini]
MQTIRLARGVDGGVVACPNQWGLLTSLCWPLFRGLFGNSLEKRLNSKCVFGVGRGRCFESDKKVLCPGSHSNIVDVYCTICEF